MTKQEWEDLDKQCQQTLKNLTPSRFQGLSAAEMKELERESNERVRRQMWGAPVDPAEQAFEEVLDLLHPEHPVDEPTIISGD